MARSGLEGREVVSIITVVRNGASVIQRAMDSVLSQRYPNVEYVLIDGGSTDGTVDLIKGHEERLAFWVSEPDDGIVDAFNKGLAKCTGEWIGILNADDWYEPGALETVVREGQGYDVVHGALRYWDGDEPRELALPNQSALIKDMTINHPTCFVRRSVYERRGAFKPEYRYAMDYELVLRFYVNGARFKQLDTVLANMSFGGVSDKQWKAASREVARAQIERGIFPWMANARLAWRLLRGSMRRSLQRLGLDTLVAA
jgi:glycosyltransferase involved in cell wall biosynthesis